MSEYIELGSVVLHDGRAYILRGFSRRSQVDGAQHVHLEDESTGAWIDVPWDDVWGTPPEEPPAVQ